MILHLFIMSCNIVSCQFTVIYSVHCTMYTNIVVLLLIWQQSYNNLYALRHIDSGILVFNYTSWEITFHKKVAKHVFQAVHFNTSQLDIFCTMYISTHPNNKFVIQCKLYITFRSRNSEYLSAHFWSPILRSDC